MIFFAIFCALLAGFLLGWMVHAGVVVEEMAVPDVAPPPVVMPVPPMTDALMGVPPVLPMPTVRVRLMDRHERKLRSEQTILAHRRRPWMFYGGRRYVAAREHEGCWIYREQA